MVTPRPALPKAFGWFGLLGPAFAVSIGYMDPGNWATDLAAGAFGYRLLWVVLVANAVALVLQIAVTNLTLATGEEFAVLTARRWPRLRGAFWMTFQAAAVATDLAEFTGIVLGLQLLLHVSTVVAVVAGLIATFSLLALGRGKAKTLDYLLIGIVGIIAVSFVLQLHSLQLDGTRIVHGAVVPEIPGRVALFAVIAMVGATVMPHNLFLHSALVHRALGPSRDPARALGIKRFFYRETYVALNIAALINGGILVVGASLGRIDGTVEGAFRALAHNIGLGVALLFGGALLLSALAASTTATLAGDYIFRAFSSWSLPAAARRSLTLVPAALALLAGASPSSLLIWSQVALALVLPIVVAPLLVFLTEAHAPRPLLSTAYAAAGICVGFDGALLLSMHP